MTAEQPTFSDQTGRVNDSPNNVGDRQGINSNDYQAGADHPSRFPNRRVERFDLPQLSISNPQQQENAFKKGDSNSDGVLELSELDQRLASRGLSSQERRLLGEMRSGYDNLTELHKSEPGHERGITRDDMAEHQLRQLDSSRTNDLLLPAERAKVTEFARGKMSQAEFQKFQQDMAKFEERSKNNPLEVAKTYREVARLLDPSQRRTAVDSDKMGALAADVMHQAADPSSVKQGNRNTCTLAALESRIYTRHPSEAARLVADVATQSQYTTADGAIIGVNRNSINTYPKFWRENPGDNDRSHASQIFQITAANVFHESQTQTGLTEVEYRINIAKNGEVQEHLVNRKTGEVEGNNPGITVFDGKGLEDVNQRITGANEPSFVIDMGKARTKEEFRKNLDQIARDNNYPALLAVNALNDPFKPEGVDIARGRVPAVPYHMIAIEPGSNRDSIMVNDNYGAERDREHSFDTLYKATKLPSEVISIPSWSDHVAGVFQQVDEKLDGKPIDPDYQTLLRRSIHEYTPEHIDAVDRAYQARTGKPLSEFLSRFITEDDMRALGYEQRWFGNGWHRGS